jgi:hypothetical protein
MAHITLFPTALPTLRQPMPFIGLQQQIFSVLQKIPFIILGKGDILTLLGR